MRDVPTRCRSGIIPPRHEYIVWCGATKLQYALYRGLIESYNAAESYKAAESSKAANATATAPSDNILIHPSLAYAVHTKVFNEAVRVCAHVRLSVRMLARAGTC